MGIHGIGKRSSKHVFHTEAIGDRLHLRHNPGNRGAGADGCGAVSVITREGCQLFRTLRTGVTPSGRQLSDFMPWRDAAKMTDDELAALYRLPDGAGEMRSVFLLYRKAIPTPAPGLLYW